MILLTHFDDGAKTFTDLGDEVIVIAKDSCQERFESIAEKYFGNNLPKFRDTTYAFVSAFNGSEVHPLYKEWKYYLLSKDGQVIKNLSFN